MYPKDPERIELKPWCPACKGYVDGIPVQSIADAIPAYICPNCKVTTWCHVHRYYGNPTSFEPGFVNAGIRA